MPAAASETTYAKSAPSGLSGAGAAEIGSCVQLMIASRKTLKPKSSPALGEGKAAKQWDFHKVHQKSENGRAAERARDHPEG